MTSHERNMNSGDAGRQASGGAVALHPAWRAFLRYCAEMRHGEIERLRIQDGLPVLAEVTVKKVKFTA